jgi:uncharacterized protein (DUF1330 family)
MPAWVFGAIQSISDPAGFAAYQGAAGPTIAKHGGKIIAAGNKIEVADGNWMPVGVVVLEFENLEKAKSWYNSSDYNPLVSRRTASSDASMVFVDGG